MNSITRFLLIFCLLAQLQQKSQTVLRVNTVHFNHVKSYKLLTGEQLVYKLKGNLFYRKDRIIAMKDSTIVLQSRGEVKLGKIKALRLNKNIHLVTSFQTVFFAGAVGFVLLNTVNNMIVDTQPVFNPTAGYISLGLFGTGLLIRELGFKRIHVNRHTDLKILNLDFEHLNADTASSH
jgi:hypothetical protein